VAIKSTLYKVVRFGWNLVYMWPTAFSFIRRCVSRTGLGQNNNNSVTALINVALWFSKVAIKASQSSSWKAILSSSMSVKIFWCAAPPQNYNSGLAKLEKLAVLSVFFSTWILIPFFTNQAFFHKLSRLTPINTHTHSLFLSGQL